jgi:hypothetical protein
MRTLATMALLLVGKTPCSICEAVIEASHRSVLFPHFVPAGHPLQNYSDSAMHKQCFSDWEQRFEFIDLFNRTQGQIVWDNGSHQMMMVDGTIETVPAGAEDA